MELSHATPTLRQRNNVAACFMNLFWTRLGKLSTLVSLILFNRNAQIVSLCALQKLCNFFPSRCNVDDNDDDEARQNRNKTL